MKRFKLKVTAMVDATKVIEVDAMTFMKAKEKVYAQEEHDEKMDTLKGWKMSRSKSVGTGYEFEPLLITELGDGVATPE